MAIMWGAILTQPVGHAVLGVEIVRKTLDLGLGVITEKDSTSDRVLVNNHIPI